MLPNPPTFEPVLDAVPEDAVLDPDELDPVLDPTSPPATDKPIPNPDSVASNFPDLRKLPIFANPLLSLFLKSSLYRLQYVLLFLSDSRNRQERNGLFFQLLYLRQENVSLNLLL